MSATASGILGNDAAPYPSDDPEKHPRNGIALDSENLGYDAESSRHDAPRVIAVEDRLSRKLSARQVQMIAIGGTIGTGLFLGTGKSLATGGPGSMLIAYLIVGGIVFVTMLALGEMATMFPVAGSFCTFAG
jgi:amino acid transporter, AAT family